MGVSLDVGLGPAHVQQIHGGNAILLYMTLYLVAIRLEGILSGLPSHIADDQLNEMDPNEQRHMYNYFNYLTASSAVGSIYSLTLVAWVQTHVEIGTGALEHHFACVYVDAPSLLLACQTIYRIHVVGGPNPILQILQVIKH